MELRGTDVLSQLEALENSHILLTRTQRQKGSFESIG